MSHSDAMEAKGFWRQFVAGYYFDTPGDSIAGFIVEHGEEGPRNDPVPRLIIQTKEGDRFRVIVTQERLLAALKAECPGKGDSIRITYTGEADKAAPGMSKAKLFTVEVRRKTANGTPQTPAGTAAVRGSAGAENASESGGKKSNG